ncbi:MAG TPA: formimidoylglutamase [Chryseolinea sp.]
MSEYFQPYAKSDIDHLIRRREGETKFGEIVILPEDTPLKSFLETIAAPFIIFGVAEDIGVLANSGNGGTGSAWNSFLQSLLNIQANHFTKPENIAVIGHLVFDDLKQEIEEGDLTAHEKIAAYRRAVTIIDEAVTELVRSIVLAQKIPIVVGGGHNNAYPIIKGTASALMERGDTKGINAVNLDAHLDYRVAEGRHSGNAFRYAKQEGFLHRYFALGIHENYIPDSILTEIRRMNDIKFITYEEVFVYQRKSWAQALEDATQFLGEGTSTGIELDLDSVEGVPTSAATPCGVSAREALQFVAHMSDRFDVKYLHICEGIATGDNLLVGKLICNMVLSFVKGFTQSK